LIIWPQTDCFTVTKDYDQTGKVGDFGGVATFLAPGVPRINIGMYELGNTAGVTTFLLCDKEYGEGCDSSSYAYAIRHPEWNTEVNPDTNVNSNDDFAVVILPEPITNIEPVELNTQSGLPTEGDQLGVFGWGITQNYPREVRPTTPRTASVSYVPNKECSTRQGVQYDISSNQMCTYSMNKSQRQGDSGE
jgi:hypothetical protein